MNPRKEATMLHLYTRARIELRERYERLVERPEAGIDDIPWKAILLVGGAMLAIALVAALAGWAQTYIQDALDQAPTGV